MRRKQRQTDEQEALLLLESAVTYHLASSDENGCPVLRVLNGVVVEDWLLFHGALVGEKVSCLEKAAVASAHRELAVIPSYFVDKERACPATTYYRSVQAKGVLQSVEEPRLKARMFQALMEKYQPEGGHLALDENLEFYAKDLKSVRVFGMRIESLSGKKSMGQDRPPERTEGVVRGLWQRGRKGDLEAIHEILEASPEARPPSLKGHIASTPYNCEVFATPALITEHARLLSGTYWRKQSSASDIERAIEHSSAWVGISGPAGELLAAARAISDGAWMAYVMDVIVVPGLRGQGLGSRLMELLLEHPALRDVPFVRLATKDAVPFYRLFGFEEGVQQGSDFVATVMTRRKRQRSEAAGQS